ncbi:MAG TPA: family 20 glycosylhydrolase [Bacilli bacterium]|nr:family 20 glycosylhydrolase [Bacilli bacterium]
MYKIYPNVKKISLNQGEFLVKEKLTVFFHNEKENVFTITKDFVDEKKIVSATEADIIFIKDTALSFEAYKIEVKEKIYIYYQTRQGALFALQTLKQIIMQGKTKIDYLQIYDEPDIKIRGFMLDISRDKVPKVATIKAIIDKMAALKMNHFELYVEGFSFGYQSFPQFLEADGYISVAEYQDLEDYANLLGIDMVPNQNGFGHMAKWLATEEYADLAECPEGIFLWGKHRKPNTLNPLDPRSLELIKKMYLDMLPYVKSPYFNMNFDEPFELGKGKAKEECEKNGIGNIYIDYVLKAYEIIKEYKKTPLIWGDVLIKHPDLLHRLPKEMIFVDWGYDATHPFDRNLGLLKDLGIKFMAAPGTTSWSSFAGRTSDWPENIANACLAVKKHGGEGVILTDWGDFGHLQFLPISYPGLVYMGLYSWRMKEGTYLLMKDYLDNYIFNDAAGIMGEGLLDLGNYYRFENDYRGNGTPTFYNFMWASIANKEEDKINYYLTRAKSMFLSHEKFNLMQKFLDFKEYELGLTKMHCSDADVVKAEIKQTINFIRISQKVNIGLNKSIDLDLRKKYLQEVVATKNSFIDEQKRLWHIRNKSGGYKDSIFLVTEFIDFAESMLDFLNKRGEDYEI